MEKTRQQTTQLVDSYNRVSAAGYMFKGQIEGLFGKAAGQVTMFASALKSMADPLTALTSLSNPAAVKQFELAFSDAMAVMGRVALPVVNAFTSAMKIVGNTYARVEPLMLRVTNAMGAGISQVFGELEKVWKSNGPMIDMMTTALTKWVKIGTQVAIVFVRVIDIFARIYSSVAKFLGFKDYSKPDASAKGSAVRSVNITSDSESVAKDAQTKAFMQAMQPAGGKAENERDLLGSLRDKMEIFRMQVIDYIKDLPKKVKDELMALVKMVINALPGKETAKAAENLARRGADNGAFGIGGLLASLAIR